MFDKKIKVWIDETPISLTNDEVKDLLLERADTNALVRERDDLTRRLELANAKLKHYGHASGF